MKFADSLSLSADHQLFVPALITFLVLFFTSLLFFIWRRLGSKADTVLFVGPSGSGKTTLFTNLITPALADSQWPLFISLKENCFTNYATENGKLLKLVDYPGSDSFKRALYKKWFDQDRKLLKCVVFLLDSEKFNKKDVAEFLYDVLFELKGKVPVLVACSKQDIGHAKSGALIQKSLEQEFGLINISRGASLSSTSGESEKRILTKSEKGFAWSDLKKTGSRLDFVECSAKVEGQGGQQQHGYSLDPVREWIGAIC